MKNATTPITQRFANWDQLEERFQANRYRGTAPALGIEQKHSAADLVVSCPHAVNHPRDGALKLADRWTGSLGELLADYVNCGYLIASGEPPAFDNWVERVDEFKRALDDLATDQKMILDLHGMSDKHGIDVCIGLGPKPTRSSLHLSNILQRELKNYNVSVNEPFSAEPEYTVTSYYQRAHGGDSLQVEIAAHLRNPRDNYAAASTFAAALGEALSKF